MSSDSFSRPREIFDWHVPDMVYRVKYEDSFRKVEIAQITLVWIGENPQLSDTHTSTGTTFMLNRWNSSHFELVLFVVQLRYIASSGQLLGCSECGSPVCA